jgi:hypothetical protein
MKEQMNQTIIKWALEICNQEGYKNTAEMTKAYNIIQLGC